jgi:hypothetical protein
VPQTHAAPCFRASQYELWRRFVPRRRQKEWRTPFFRFPYRFPKGAPNHGSRPMSPGSLHTTRSSSAFHLNTGMHDCRASSYWSEDALIRCRDPVELPTGMYTSSGIINVSSNTSWGHIATTKNPFQNKYRSNVYDPGGGVASPSWCHNSQPGLRGDRCDSETLNLHLPHERSALWPMAKQIQS